MTFVLGDLPEEDGFGGSVGSCLPDGDVCSLDRECCGNLCFESTCQVRSPACQATGETCDEAFDCCSLSCVDGLCADACAGDSDSCERDEECCSSTCQDGACLPLTDRCGTSGNNCVTNGECCSGLCWQGTCDADGSYCAQTDDACRSGTDCCSGVCTVEPGRVLGTCSAPPSGAANCQGGIAGTLCSECNDCCSRLCVPYGARGIFVCALAEGCRQTGELCAEDEECCGGDATTDLPGAGNVRCDKLDDAAYGVCRNAISCSPQGNVCHVQDYACGVSAAANKCCAAEGQTGTCRLDGQGVPRCDGLGGVCREDGAACAMNEDCCSGSCLPDEDGLLGCTSTAACFADGETCTAPSECCPGTTCSRVDGMSFGVCSEDGAVACSLVGQLCGGAFPECCTNSSCGPDGRCQVPMVEEAQ